MVPLLSSCPTAPSMPATYWEAPSIASSHRAFPFTLSFHLVQMQPLAEAGLTGAMAVAGLPIDAPTFISWVIYVARNSIPLAL